MKMVQRFDVILDNDNVLRDGESVADFQRRKAEERRAASSSRSAPVVDPTEPARSDAGEFAYDASALGKPEPARADAGEFSYDPSALGKVGELPAAPWTQQLSASSAVDDAERSREDDAADDQSHLPPWQRDLSASAKRANAKGATSAAFDLPQRA